MSTPLFDPDDPRLTAYALGESSDAEREAIEQLLAVSPEAREAVEQTRTFAHRLEAEFAHENTAYQEARPQPVIATNVIAFPTARRRWRPAMVLGWKIAAVFVALGSLVLFIGRRTPPASVATVQPSASKEMIEPPPPTEKMTPTSAASPEASTDADKLLAAADQESRDSDAKPDIPLSAPAADRAATASLQRERSASPPGAAPPAAAPMAPKATSSDERLARVVVRLRLEDGTFVGAVLLSRNGWILAAKKLAALGNPGRLVAVLADRRETAIAATGGTQLLAPGLLQIRAGALPSASFATEPPANGSQLVVARIDASTGLVSFLRARANRVGDRMAVTGAMDDDLLFNEAGQLLITERSASTAKSAPRARGAARREEVEPLFVRPITASEMAYLPPLPK